MITQIQKYVADGPFEVPVGVHLAAGFLFSLTGALAGIRRGYDFVGVFLLALVVGMGGGLMRDGLFLQQGPPLVTRDWRYLPPVLAACLLGWAVHHWIIRLEKVIAVLDAVGLSIYTLVGFFMSLEADLSVPAAIMVGIINAAGGGLLRDILTHEEPLLFKPGQFYVLAAFAGCVVFLVLAYRSLVTPPIAIRISMATIFVLRILAIRLNWRTSPLEPWFTPTASGSAPGADKTNVPPPVDPSKAR